MNENYRAKGSGLVRALWVACMLFLALGATEHRCQAGDKPAMPNSAQKKEIEAALSSLAKVIKEQPPSGEATYDLLISHLKANPLVLGAALAFAPVKKDGRAVKTSPYVYLKDGQYVKKDLALEGDYLAEEWYAQPVKRKKPYWSKPYFDTLGAQMNMITYSIPIYTGKSSNKLLGVLTSDLAIK